MGDETDALVYSARNFASMSGLVMMYIKVERIAVAVVSEPAMLGL